MTHTDLVEAGYKWVLKRGGCGVAFKELNTMASNGEYPDVIGFCSGNSTVIECKMTKKDFYADKRKLFRQHPELGMGRRRYYLCPDNIIKTEDLPYGWGLIYVNDKQRILLIHQPKGIDGRPYEHAVNALAEQQLMYSALRRLMIKGYMKYIYDRKYEFIMPDDIIELNK